MGLWICCRQQFFLGKELGQGLPHPTDEKVLPIQFWHKPMDSQLHKIIKISIL